MSAAVHTPGPWLLDDEGYGSYRVYVKGAIICSRNQWRHRIDESIANAKLISAAPDLLDALKYALRMVNASECDIGFIKAAIAKATGAAA